MHSYNQDVILGINTFEKWNRTAESSCSTDGVPCCCRLDFKLYSLLLQCSGRVQSNNGVNLVEVFIFYKSENMRGQTVRPKQ